MLLWIVKHWKITGAGVSILLLIAAYVYVRTTAYQDGWDAHKAKIEQEQREAEKIAEERIKQIRRDYERRLQAIYDAPDDALPVGSLTSSFFDRVRDEYEASNK